MKIKDIEDKIPDHSVYNTTNDFNRFLSTILQDLDTAEQCTIENKKRIEKLQAFDFSYFYQKILSLMMVFKISLSTNI